VIANLALDTGIAPHLLEKETPRMIFTLQAAIRYRNLKAGDTS
jgi:hypothetical protein